MEAGRLALDWQAWRRALDASQSELQKIHHSVEDERCASDLMYATLWYPNREIKPGQTLIDRVLEGAFAVIAKKYAPDFGKVDLIRRTRAYLLGPQCHDTYVKRFYWLCQLHAEPELQELVRAAFVEQPGQLWHNKAEAHAHFALFLTHLGTMVQQTLQWPCSVINITDVVVNFVEAARRQYVTMGE